MDKLTVEQLVGQSHRTALEKGWWDTDRGFLECLMLTVSEISEAAEEYRMYGLNTDKYIYLNGEKPEGIAVELADAVVRIADLCGHHGIPLEKALEVKMKYNQSRPYKHGKLA